MPIQTKELYFSYLPKTKNIVYALKNINLSFIDKKITAVVGKTGSGKSTLIQQLNGLILPTSGEVSYENIVVTPNKRKNKNGRELRKKIGVVFQFPEYQLFEETVLKDVAFGPINYKVKEIDALNKAKESLSLVGIDESFYERSPFELSGGERRKVAIAGILAIDPDVIIFDEPTAGLDNKSADELLNLIVELNKKGKTIIIVTHDMDIVYEYAHEVVVLEDGEVVFNATPFELFFDSKNLYSLELPKVVRGIKEILKFNPNFEYQTIKSLDGLVGAIKGAKAHE